MWIFHASVTLILECIICHILSLDLIYCFANAFAFLVITCLSASNECQYVLIVLRMQFYY